MDKEATLNFQIKDYDWTYTHTEDGRYLTVHASYHHIDLEEDTFFEICLVSEIDKKSTKQIKASFEYIPEIEEAGLKDIYTTSFSYPEDLFNDLLASMKLSSGNEKIFTVIHLTVDGFRAGVEKRIDNSTTSFSLSQRDANRSQTLTDFYFSLEGKEVGK